MDDKKRANPAGLLIVAVIAWYVWSHAQPAPAPPDPVPPTPTPASLAAWVDAQASKITGNTVAHERAELAKNYQAVADEIETLSDPLAVSTLKRPADAIARIAVANQTTLGIRAVAWMPFFDALCKRFEELDAEKKVLRSIYGVGELYAQVADGLRGAQDMIEGTGLLRTVAHAEDFDPERAYLENQVTGCLIDEPGQPEWARDLARQGEEDFQTAGGQQADVAFPRCFAGEGKGKRAVYWNYALRFDGDPLPVFAIKQITGNCVEASNGDVTLTHLLGVEIFLLRKPYTWEGPGSTAFYAWRGHCGQGMNLGTAAASHLAQGTAWRKAYLGGKYDLRDTLADQRLGMANCRNPSQLLQDLWAETRETPVGTVARFDGGADEAMDVLFAGGALHTGSTATAARDGDPVCSGGRVGSHAQTCIGYDDTQEFRDWYKQQTGKTLTEPVFMFDQTWGANPYIKSNWPAHLWGRPTPGMFCLRWSDARRLIGSTCYAYWPDLQGVTPERIEWRIARAKSISSGGLTAQREATPAGWFPSAVAAVERAD